MSLWRYTCKTYKGNWKDRNYKNLEKRKRCYKSFLCYKLRLNKNKKSYKNNFNFTIYIKSLNKKLNCDIHFIIIFYIYVI